MELSEIWISIIIPIVIGPVFVYLKSLRDEIAEKRYKSKREKYVEERDYLFTVLDKFYWPLYINLLYIDQYSYNLPIKNKFRYDSSSEASNYSENSYNNHTIGKDDTLYYSLSLDQSDTPEYEVQNKNTDTLNTDTLNTLTNINININEFDIDTEYNKLNRSPINIESDSSSDNYEISIPVTSNKDTLKRKIFSKTVDKKIILDKVTLNLFESILNNKYNEIVSIIETNISRVCIHENLNIEIIKFIKYAKIRDIIHEGNPEQEYNIEYFGVENNVKHIIYLFKQELDIKNKRYSDLILNPV
tara:strand:- start:1166 stop:2071 length:906 start_codon:yes stop_codon:yes gene_type:complete